MDAINISLISFGAVFLTAFISSVIAICVIKKKSKIKQVNLDSYYKLAKEQYDLDFKLFQNQLFIDAIESITYRKLNYQTFRTVRCSDDERKKRILGKNSHNKRIIENITGTNILIQEDSPLLKISSSNPYKREICRILLENLINSESDCIDEIKINKYYEKAVLQAETEAINLGKDVLENDFNVTDINPKIYFYLGKLKHRFSYNQSNLEHSIETGKIAGFLAKKLGVDPNIAALSGLFHDIGKSIDLENNQSHIETGLAIAQECSLSDDIVFCIKNHHEKSNMNNIYLAIVKIADKLSASKEAARQGQQEDIEYKTKMIQNIIREFNEVKKSFCAKSAHFVGIILNPKDKLGIQEQDDLVERIKRRILLEEEFHNYILDVQIINKGK